MRKFLTDPWTIAIVGAILTAILAEIPPLHLISTYVSPLIVSFFIFLLKPIEIQRWAVLFGPAFGAVFFALAMYVYAIIRRKQATKIFQGFSWEKSQDGDRLFRPICKKCRLPLQARIEPEERKDRNNVSFHIVPEQPNALVCSSCNVSTRLNQPLNEFMEAANAALIQATKSASPSPRRLQIHDAEITSSEKKR